MFSRLPCSPDPRCIRRYCIHAAGAAASTKYPSTTSNRHDRRFLRRRLGANARPLELETPQQQRLLASRSAAAALVGAAVERSRRLGQVRQLHANRGYHGGGLGLLADAVSNKQPRVDDPPLQHRCVPARGCWCVPCRLAGRKSSDGTTAVVLRTAILLLYSKAPIESENRNS